MMKLVPLNKGIQNFLDKLIISSSSKCSNVRFQTIRSLQSTPFDSSHYKQKKEARQYNDFLLAKLVLLFVFIIAIEYQHWYLSTQYLSIQVVPIRYLSTQYLSIILIQYSTYQHSTYQQSTFQHSTYLHRYLSTKY